MTYIVVYTRDGSDHWEAFRDDEAGAKKRYEEISENEELYSASLTVVLESTDYL